MTPIHHPRRAVRPVLLLPAALAVLLVAATVRSQVPGVPWMPYGPMGGYNVPGSITGGPVPAPAKPARPGKYVGDRFVLDGETPAPAAQVVHGTREDPAVLELSLAQELRLVLDPMYGGHTKAQQVQKLLAAGVELVPLLVACMEDERPFGTDRELQALYLVQVHHVATLAPANVTYAQACKEILTMLIHPQRRSPYERHVDAQQAFLFTSDHWPQWWQAHQDMALEDIREEMEPLVDRFFQQNGVVQKVAVP